MRHDADIADVFQWFSARHNREPSRLGNPADGRMS
jgi:hypothetical protein